jgi:hypothetical protein
MFHPSAATDTLQGSAIQRINERWGEDKHRGWENYKNIGIPVCKKKYRPFEFKVKSKTSSGGGMEITVVRMYGCCSHSNLRKKVIERHGERDGWEPFGQWSLRKAKDAAKKETQRLNEQWNALSTCSSSDTSSSSSSSEDEQENESMCFLTESSSMSSSSNKQQQQQPWQALCANGTCSWKVRGKFDDICSEIEEERLNNTASIA